MHVQLALFSETSHDIVGTSLVRRPGRNRCGCVLNPANSRSCKLQREKLHLCKVEKSFGATEAYAETCDRAQDQPPSSGSDPPQVARMGRLLLPLWRPL